MTVWIIIAIICFVVAGGLLWWRHNTMRDLGLMAQVETSAARDAAAKPPGTLVEVKGVVRSEAPLQSEYARIACVHYVATQTERYAVHDHDSQGRPRRREETRTLYSNTRSAPFVVEDGSGWIRVQPEGASIEGAEVFNQTQGRGGFSGSVTIGDMTIGAGGPIDQTWRESAVGLDQPIYVLGVIRPGGVIGAPEPGRKDAGFIISVKSEEQRTADKSGEAGWLMIIAIVLGVAGAACLVIPRLI